MKVLADKFLNNPVFALALIQAAALLFLPAVISVPVTALLEVAKRELVTPEVKAKARERRSAVRARATARLRG